MNESIETWSSPWHELQRSLAAGGIASGSAHVRMHPGAKVRVKQTTTVALPAMSWMVRARTRTVSATSKAAGAK